MQRVAVELGVHRHGGDAELAGRADDPHGDLTAVGDQDLLQHGCQCRCRGRTRRDPTSAWPPGWTRRARRRDRQHQRRPARRPRPTRPDRSVLVADHQTAGRGPARPPLGRAAGREPARVAAVPRRAGRIRASSPGGSASPPSTPAARPPASTAGAEVAQRRARRRAQAGRDPRRARRRRATVVVGLGLNVGWAPDGRGRLGDGIDPLDVLAALLAAFDRLPADVSRALPPDARHARPSGPDRAGRTACSTARRSTSTPTAGSVVVDACAVTHRIDVGDVDPPPLTAIPADAGCPRGPATSPPLAGGRVRKPTPTPAGRAGPRPGRARRRRRAAPGCWYSARERSERRRAGHPTSRRCCAANDGPAENFLLVGSDSPGRASTPAIPNAVDRRRGRGQWPAQRHDHGPAPRGGRRGVPAQPAPRPVGPDRRHRPARRRSTRRTTRDRSASPGRSPSRSASRSTTTSRSTSTASRELVDEIGGVEICVDVRRPGREHRAPAQSRVPGRNGEQALAYARSRHYEEFIDGDWQDGPQRSDLGRIARQQLFIRTAVAKLLRKVRRDPFALGDLIGAATGAVRIDEDVDPVDAADALCAAAEDGLATYTLPVVRRRARRPSRARARRGSRADPRLLPRRRARARHDDAARVTGARPTSAPDQRGVISGILAGCQP